jgi:hypothetical protein
MNNVAYPKLTEPGVSYFLRETLKQCNTNKSSHNVFIFNLSLLLGFVALITIILVYKHKTKLSDEELKNKDTEKKTYLLTKIKELSDIHQKKYNKMITNLPKFESEFEKMHKYYYNI